MKSNYKILFGLFSVLLVGPAMLSAEETSDNPLASIRVPWLWGVDNSSDQRNVDNPPQNEEQLKKQSEEDSSSSFSPVVPGKENKEKFDVSVRKKEGKLKKGEAARQFIMSLEPVAVKKALFFGEGLDKYRIGHQLGIALKAKTIKLSDLQERAIALNDQNTAEFLGKVEKFCTLWEASKNAPPFSKFSSAVGLNKLASGKRWIAQVGAGVAVGSASIFLGLLWKGASRVINMGVNNGQATYEGMTVLGRSLFGIIIAGAGAAGVAELFL